MIKSMTGYGRGQNLIDNMNITVEIKSVNHRYFEFYARTPRNYMFLEEKLKHFFNGELFRGKVECYVQIDNLENENVDVIINLPLAQGYVSALHELENKFNIPFDVTATQLSRFNDILSVRKKEEDEDKIWSAVESVARQALIDMISMRISEGEKLKNDVLSRADYILEQVKIIEERSPQTVKEYNEKLLSRIKDLLADTHIEEQRILMESAIYADKIAVDEETVRLRSHIEQLKVFFESDEAIGRKMDFLVQEMNREANTIGSKAQDVEIARCVLDIKSEIEKIREQIQNIE